jgi:stress response protein YsnF
MALYKVEDFAADSDYSSPDLDHNEVEKIKHFDVYSDIDNDKVGTIKYILVDDSGRMRYLVVDTGFWFFGRQVLLPIGRSRIDYDKQRVYANRLTKEQVKNLPDFKDLQEIDYDYEERVRGVYRPPIAQEPLESSTPLESPIPVDVPAVPREPTRVAPVIPPITPVTPDHRTYRYEEEPNLYNVNEQDHKNLKLYEERLVATKSRVKTGEVTISKQPYTEMVTVSVPVQKERIVIEHTNGETGTKTVSLTDADLGEGEVKIKKIVEQDTVEAEGTIRREELDVNRHDQRVGERRN